MLLSKGKITRDMIALLDKWRHSGFNAFFGPRILPGQEESMENLFRLSVRFASMPYNADINDSLYVVYRIDDSIFPNSYTPKLAGP